MNGIIYHLLISKRAPLLFFFIIYEFHVTEEQGLIHSHNFCCAAGAFPGVTAGRQQ